MRRLALLLALIPSGPALADAGDPVTGRDVFVSYCAVCHGMRAVGDGPMASVLTGKPADLTRLAASNSGVFPVMRVVRQVDGRDPMLAHGGEMPLYGDLFQFPDGAIASETGQPIITAQPIADVAAYLATIQE